MKRLILILISLFIIGCSKDYNCAIWVDDPVYSYIESGIETFNAKDASDAKAKCQRNHPEALYCVCRD
jgi:hypothetical protein